MPDHHQGTPENGSDPCRRVLGETEPTKMIDEH